MSFTEGLSKRIRQWKDAQKAEEQMELKKKYERKRKAQQKALEREYGGSDQAPDMKD